MKRIWRVKNYRIAIVVTVVLVVWLLSGLLHSNGEKKNIKTEPVALRLVEVRAKTIHAQAYTSVVRLSGRTEAAREVHVRAELSGLISALPVEKGSRVRRGDVLCELAIEDRQERYDESKAAVAKAQLVHDGALRMKSGGYQSRTAIATAKAELETARANLKRRELDLHKLKIRAPFDGVVDGRPVEIGDLMQRGDICAKILDLNPIKIAVQVSSSEINKVVLGAVAEAVLLTGEQLHGVVSFIASDSDNITRAFRVEVSVDNPQLSLYSGVTSQLLLPTGEQQAHQISPSLLSLDDKGKIGVRILDQQHRVQFREITLLGESASGVWVTGLPEKTLLITVGQEYVTPGQHVAVVVVESQIDQSGIAE